MRYQQPIYIQSDSSVRNKDIINVNMSSDISIFEAPLFSVSGASKIDCSGTTSSYVISTATTIPLSFIFTANTNSFTSNTTTFKYEIYKYNSNAGVFSQPPVYKSSLFNYSGFSGTSTISENILVSSLVLDGEYLIKGFYEYTNSTEYATLLGKSGDTLDYLGGKQYSLYDSNLDYYFAAIKEADKPIFQDTGSNTPNANRLFQQVIIPKKTEKSFTISYGLVGDFLVTLNGLVLAPNYDYTLSGSVITLVENAIEGDIITIIYTTSGGSKLTNDNIYVTTTITSGATDSQGDNQIYYNTTKNKFEVFTSLSPEYGGSIIVMVNGAILANGIDYYQSISNTKRIILEGEILVGDIITLVYFPSISVVNGILTNSPIVSWRVTPPQLINGTFTLEVSTGSSFNTLYSSSSQDYVIGQSTYNDTFVASGSVGTYLYYRVKNDKNYINICGSGITSTVYSDVVPIIIQTNSINSY